MVSRLGNAGSGVDVDVTFAGAAGDEVDAYRKLPTERVDNVVDRDNSDRNGWIL
jgi:hypothetical protein